MNLVPLAVSAAASDSSLAYLGPVLLLVGAVVVALINAAGVIWRRRQDKSDATAVAVVGKQMTEAQEDDALTQARLEATKYYNFYVYFRNLFYNAQDTLRRLVRKLRDEHPDMQLDKDVVDTLALNPESDNK